MAFWSWLARLFFKRAVPGLLVVHAACNCGSLRCAGGYDMEGSEFGPRVPARAWPPSTSMTRRPASPSAPEPPSQRSRVPRFLSDHLDAAPFFLQR